MGIIATYIDEDDKDAIVSFKTVAYFTEFTWFHSANSKDSFPRL